jgi:hypothetical protein
VKLASVKQQLKVAYKDDPEYKGRFIVAQLVYHKANERTDIMGTIKNYFFDIPEEEVLKIKSIVDGR